MIIKNTTWFDEYNTHGDSDKAMKALKKSEPDFRFKYIPSDGWRGYWQSKATKKSGWREYKENLAGWMTGEWDDAPEGTKGSELEALLNKIDAKEIKIIFLPTSNVFSTAYDVFIK